MTYSIKRGSTHGTGELHSEMEAVHLDAGGEKKQVASPVNLTNHAYWNLSGNCRRSVRDHGLLLRCDRYLPLDDNQVCALCLACRIEIVFAKTWLWVQPCVVRSYSGVGHTTCVKNQRG